MHDMVLSPYSCWSISSVCDGVFSSWTKNFKFIHSSVHIAEQFEKEEYTKTGEKNAMIMES